MPTRILFVVLLAQSLTGAELPQGTRIGRIALRDLSGREQTFATSDQLTAIIFVSARCPLTWEYFQRIQVLKMSYSSKGIRFLLVNANVNEPDSEVAEQIRQFRLTVPIYRDTRQKLVDQLGARVTPQVFVLDRSGMVRYRGSVDDARNPARVQRQYLKEAIDAVWQGSVVPTPETRVLGCSIKSGE